MKIDIKYEWLAPAPPPVESPCIGVCTLDDEGMCMGCHRSTDEIAGWVSMTDDERRAVLARVDERALGQ